jgi:hypothetical protein
MTNYINHNVWKINQDFDITKVWRFAEICENKEIDGIRSIYNMPRINKLFEKNGMELTDDMLATILNFKSNLTDLDLFLKNLFANNGNRKKIKNMGVFYNTDISNEIHPETGMRVIGFIGISPIHEKKSGTKIGMVSGDKKNFVKI